MAEYKVEPVVSDYGVYENNELKLICSNRRNALLIKAIMEKDNKYMSGFNGNPQFTILDFNSFIAKHLEGI